MAEWSFCWIDRSGRVPECKFRNTQAPEDAENLARAQEWADAGSDADDRHVIVGHRYITKGTSS